MRRDRTILLLLSLAILIPGTWGVSLIDHDEGWYAQVARERVESGDWLVPRYLGDVWLHNPPLLNWLVSASWTVFGMGEASARLVSVLAMAASTQLVCTLGSGMAPGRAGYYAGVTFITAGLPAIVGKMLLTDSVLLVCCCGAFVLLWRMATDGVTSSRAAGFWACVGLAVLAKGPAVTTDAIVDALRGGDAPVVAVVDGDTFEALPLELREAVDWQRIDGVNHVHMEHTTVRIGRFAGHGSR